jgi:hypothetical protein
MCLSGSIDARNACASSRAGRSTSRSSATSIACATAMIGEAIRHGSEDGARALGSALEHCGRSKLRRSRRESRSERCAPPHQHRPRERGAPNAERGPALRAGHAHSADADLRGRCARAGLAVLDREPVLLVADARKQVSRCRDCARGAGAILPDGSRGSSMRAAAADHERSALVRFAQVSKRAC